MIYRKNYSDWRIIEWNTYLSYANLIRAKTGGTYKMEVNTFLAIENRLNCNDTIDEQKKYVPLIIEILKINQEVIKEGLSALEKHIQDDKLPFLLKKGLRLIHYAMEPQIIETILLNTAIVNCIDGLTALICLDGALSIQRMYSPDITKELLCSYLSPDLSD